MKKKAGIKGHKSKLKKALSTQLLQRKALTKSKNLQFSGGNVKGAPKKDVGHVSKKAKTANEDDDAPELVDHDEDAEVDEDDGDQSTKETKEAIPPPKKVQIPFSSNDTILLVGEGNLSFARSLIETVGGKIFIATCFDSESVLHEKYEDAESNAAAIRELEGTVHYSIDATNLQGHRLLKNKRFSKIVFNFPHTGSGVKDVDRNIRGNQELCLRFLKSAKGLLTAGGEILVTLRSGQPYDSWQIKSLAKRADLRCKTTLPFHPSFYPNYVHRRTIGFDSAISSDSNEDILRSKCYTCVFIDSSEPIVQGPGKKRKKVNEDDDSD